MKKAKKKMKRLFKHIHNAVLLAVTVAAAITFVYATMAIETADLMTAFIVSMLCLGWLFVFFYANSEVKR